MKESRNSHTAGPGLPCHVCTAPALQLVPGYENFWRVTSDCKPWPKGGRLGVCRSCGNVQKVLDQEWQREVDQIYEAYSIYHQSQGTEQAVYDANSGGMASRSAHLLAHLFSQITLPASGRLLDVGCGNGSLLYSFNRIAPRWSLVGVELHSKYQDLVESIDGVEALFTCSPEEVPGKFNLITMVHVLEHIPNPQDFINTLWDKLEAGGLLVLEVPDFFQNPFDLLIADHCTHFTASLLTNLIHSAGYEIIKTTGAWIPKELTLIARKASQGHGGKTLPLPANPWLAVINGLNWLESVVTAARKIAARGNLGLFGTSIAATWLFSELTTSIDFFVDEDQHRAGKTFMERPIYFPQDVPGGSHVFLSLAFNVAELIAKRLTKLYPDIIFHLPPPIKPSISNDAHCYTITDID